MLRGEQVYSVMANEEHRPEHAPQMFHLPVAFGTLGLGVRQHSYQAPQPIQHMLGGGTDGAKAVHESFGKSPKIDKD